MLKERVPLGYTTEAILGHLGCSTAHSLSTHRTRHEVTTAYMTVPAERLTKGHQEQQRTQSEAASQSEPPRDHWF